MKKRLSLLVVSVALFMAIGLTAIPARAAGITVRAATMQGNAGDTVDIAIEGKGVDNIAALEMALVYDSAILTFDSLNPGSLGQGTSIVTNSDTPGRLGISIATARSISGDGALATARFKVIGQAGQSSTLNFENATAWESDHLREVAVAVEAGTLTVAAGLPNWLIYLVVALVLLLILIFALTRRRKPAVAPVPYAQGGYAQPQQPYASPQHYPNQQLPAQQYNQPPAPQYGQVAPPTTPSQQTVYCNNCGNPNTAGSAFCSTCGSPLARLGGAPRR